MTIAILGAGAFGTALAVSFAGAGHATALWCRNTDQAGRMEATRENQVYLPDVALPPRLTITTDIPDADAYLIAVPMQKTRALIGAVGDRLAGKVLVACSKGLSLATGKGPTSELASLCSAPAILTGPSFAADIARGLPTALTLACENEALGLRLQERLSTPNLRLYRTTDVTGAELGGALKNVIAIGCGAVIGARLGDSARAALLTRGFAEMLRFAEAAGARRDTLLGLSGLGDLTLTCTSGLSRNYRFGQALGAGSTFDTGETVEGAATARALATRAREEGIDMPVTDAILAVIDGEMSVNDAMQALLSRPPKEE